MDDIRDQLEQETRALCGLAEKGEILEARSIQLLRRKHRVEPDRVQSSAVLTDRAPSVVRLARNGRDVYVSADSLAAGTASTLVETARALLPLGRPFPDCFASRPRARWNDEAFAADMMSEPAGPLKMFRHAADQLAKNIGTRHDVELRNLDCLVAEQVRVEAFASSERGSDSYACTALEAQVLAEVRRGSRQIRLWVTRHANKLRDVPVEDLLIEAGWCGAAFFSPVRDRPAEHEILLTPQVSASVLRLLVQDLIERRFTPRAEQALPYVLLDDPHAPGGRHSRPFDHEGVPTGESVLLDRHGVVGRLACRGDSWGNTDQGPTRPVALTGNGLMPALKGVPEVQPTNVRLADGEGYALPGEYTGRLGFAIKGDGVQRYRSGSRIRFRLETAEVSDGAVTERGSTLFLAGSLPELLSAVRGVSPAASYASWGDYSTAQAWTFMSDMPSLATSR